MQARLQILLVEDHADSAMLMRRFLTKLGCEVVHAENVQSAMASVSGKLPDLVMTDLSLPDGDGASLVLAIRKLGSVPAIAISGHPVEDELRDLFVHHFIKPLDWKVLETTLRSFLPETDAMEK